MLIVGAARVLQFILLLLTLRLATTMLPPAEMGKIALVTSTYGLFALLLVNPVGMFINRRMHAWDQQGRVKGYLHYFWIYLACVSVTAMALLYLVLNSGWWTPGIDQSHLLLLVGASLAFGTVNQAVIPWLNSIGANVWFAVLTVATTLVSLGVALVLVQTIEPVASLWVAGLIGGQLLVGVMALILFGRKLKVVEGDCQTALSRDKILQLFRFAWPVAVAVSLGWIQSQSYRFIVEQRMGLAELGLFVAGFGISAGISAGFESIVSTYFQPIFQRQINSGEENSAESAWKSYAQHVLPSITLTAFFIIALAPQMTQLLLGPDYKDSLQYIMWGAVSEWARTSVGVFSLFAHAKMKTNMLIYPNLLGAILAVFFVWVLIRLVGSAGIGPALVIAAFGSLALSYFVTKRLTVVSISIHKVVLLGAMGGILLLVARLPYFFAGENSGMMFAVLTTILTGIVFCGFQLIFLYRFILPAPKADSAKPASLS